MNQAAFLRQFDANAIGAFFGAGLADAATYQAPTPEGDDPVVPAPVSCTVLVDRNVTDFGDDLAPVSVPVVLVTFQRSEVEPAGGTVTLTGTGEAFSLIRRVRADESVSRWEVQHAQPT